MAPDTIAWGAQRVQPRAAVLMYGQTEATSRSLICAGALGGQAGLSASRSRAWQLAVVDEAAGLSRRRDRPLVARGDNVTAGYLDEPEETAAILHHGWLWTATSHAG